MKNKSLGKSQYFNLYTNDYSRMSWAYFLSFKLKAFENFRKFKALVLEQTDSHIKSLCTVVVSFYLMFLLCFVKRMEFAKIL